MLTPRYRLWIDGVGCWNLRFGTEWRIGGPGSGADLEMLAPLGANAMEWSYAESSYSVALGQEVRGVQGQETLVLDSGVSFHFRKPHPWSQAATIEPTSSHRPVDQSDGLVLGAGSCVLGPEEDCHIRCRGWVHGLVLFERDKQLHWKRFDGPCDLNPVNRLGPDALIETDDVRVSVEQVD